MNYTHKLDWYDSVLAREDVNIRLSKDTPAFFLKEVAIALCPDDWAKKYVELVNRYMVEERSNLPIEEREKLIKLASYLRISGTPYKVGYRPSRTYAPWVITSSGYVKVSFHTYEKLENGVHKMISEWVEKTKPPK